jgi:TRAP-type C4-dicarboxylate transport system permease small subunit
MSKLIVVALLVMAWVGGQLMLASHVNEHTHTGVGLAIVAVVIVGGSIMFKVRSRRG